MADRHGKVLVRTDFWTTHEGDKIINPMVLVTSKDDQKPGYNAEVGGNDFTVDAANPTNLHIKVTPQGVFWMRAMYPSANPNHWTRIEQGINLTPIEG